MQQKRIAVIGAGSWGTAIANAFSDSGLQVTLWAREFEVVKGINQNHRNPLFLKGFDLAKQLRASSDLRQTIEEAEVVVCVVPTQYIRATFTPYAASLKSKWIVNAAKGIEEQTYLRVSQIFAAVCPEVTYAILSGPSFAEEVIRRLPTAITAACEDLEVATSIQKLLNNSYLRVYASRDVVGAELGGALKNVIAIAAGIASGLGLGLNAQAALINRGIAEIVRMGQRQGAQPISFLGLSGMGDLILTCTGDLSRNRRLGIGLGEGKSLQRVQEELGGIAEGVATTRAAFELAKRHQIDMPIVQQVYEILYNGRTPKKALTELMGRDPKMEWDLG